MDNVLDLLTPEILELRKEFRKEALKIDREGMQDLLDFLDDSGFYNAPASTRYHLAEKGGLARHSLNVLEYALDLNNALEAELEPDSVRLVALFHDLGKGQYYNKSFYEPRYLKSGKPAATPYERNKDLIPLQHELISLHKLSQFVELTEDETWAIVHHNGMYGDLKFQLQGKERPLQQLIHMADLWVSRFTESRGY